ncbi:YigZ family protein [Celerinatantimonas diazotrophica]|uniref:Putative YigZ family protein n=1 Tax=Celerinatantimonas diazotrophica TaxID=412034 RepID=A0A4R1JB16_9GAMM|nr:YigZ family protein [Celerinatantimonas diazotrophica]TCK47309.1 putative YigZ family protein [Celerinatantimonas diazotrophica]CAG9295075.1 IMPACT family member YigZ [Celerinatantimonas diazotrophica]
MSSPFNVPVAEVESSQLIKKSRFITHLLPVTDREHAFSQIEQLRQQYPDARHHCWAFIAGAPDDTQVLGFSDDGEPNGTAGKPILAQLQGSGLGYVLAVVIRYFGGIKLGTGGLVRAYGSSVAQALAIVETHPYIAKTTLSMEFGFDALGEANQLFTRFNVIQQTIDYNESVCVTVELPAQHRQQFMDALTNACRGQVEFQMPLQDKG